MQKKWKLTVSISVSEPNLFRNSAKFFDRVTWPNYGEEGGEEGEQNTQDPSMQRSEVRGHRQMWHQQHTQGCCGCRDGVKPTVLSKGREQKPQRRAKQTSGRNKGTKSYQIKETKLSRDGWTSSLSHSHPSPASFPPSVHLHPVLSLPVSLLV